MSAITASIIRSGVNDRRIMAKNEKSSRRYLGCHVSAAGGLHNALLNGEALGVNTIQVHASPPQRWNSKPFPSGVEDTFLDMFSRSPVEKVFFHGIYLINLAGEDSQKLALSRLSLLNSLDLMARIGGEGVIFHVGSALDEREERQALRKVAAAMNWILERAAGGRLIMEVAAGSGSVIGDRMEELAEVYELIEQKERVGYALDTQHMWASGYDWRRDLEAIARQVKTVLGKSKVWAIHLNDSKTDLASRRDRHENLGKGKIGASTMAAILAHPLFKDTPFILESPGLKTPEGARAEVKRLRQLAARGQNQRTAQG